MRRYKGFTLIELLVVIAIIGLLASIVLVSLNSARNKARDTRRISDLNQIQLALEFFYDTYSRYPTTAGHAYWDGHWMNFQTCLETGVGCGFTITGYNPVMTNVPQDPLDSDPEVADNGRTYYYGYPGCEKGYRLVATLEVIDPADLSDDLDGSFYNNNNGCSDSLMRYCLGVGTCSGF